MKFGLIDRIVELTPSRRIVAVKAVSLAEEYLADHFPTFPVLPGVLMLEAMAEAGAWLVYEAQDFEPHMILLREAKNVTYKSFVSPGHTLTLTVDCRRMSQEGSEFSGVGHCKDEEVVRARFSLTHLTLARSGDQQIPRLKRLVEIQRERFARLRSPVG